MSKSGESWVDCKFVIIVITVKVLITVFKVFSTYQHYTEAVKLWICRFTYMPYFSIQT